MREDNAGIMLPERGLRFSLKKNNVDIRYKFKKTVFPWYKTFITFLFFYRSYFKMFFFRFGFLEKTNNRNNLLLPTSMLMIFLPSTKPDVASFEFNFIILAYNGNTTTLSECQTISVDENFLNTLYMFYLYIWFGAFVILNDLWIIWWHASATDRSIMPRTLDMTLNSTLYRHRANQFYASHKATSTVFHEVEALSVNTAACVKGGGRSCTYIPHIVTI